MPRCPSELNRHVDRAIRKLIDGTPARERQSRIQEVELECVVDFAERMKHLPKIGRSIRQKLLDFGCMIMCCVFEQSGHAAWHLPVGYLMSSTLVRSAIPISILDTFGPPNRAGLFLA